MGGNQSRFVCTYPHKIKDCLYPWGTCILILYRLGGTCNHVAAILFKAEYQWLRVLTVFSKASHVCVWVCVWYVQYGTTKQFKLSYVYEGYDIQEAIIDKYSFSRCSYSSCWYFVMFYMWKLHYISTPF